MTIVIVLYPLSKEANSGFAQSIPKYLFIAPNFSFNGHVPIWAVCGTIFSSSKNNSLFHNWCYVDIEGLEVVRLIL